MDSLPWYIISGLSAATTLLLCVIIFCVVRFFKNRNTLCLTGTDPDKCESPKCTKLLKKDLNHLLILFVVVLVFILVDLFIDDKDAMDYFSFASTIASIILSVVAIIFSITGDSRTEGLKRVLDKAISELKEATDTIKNYTTTATNQEKVFKDILENSTKILGSIKDIQEDINTVKDDIDDIRNTTRDSSDYGAFIVPEEDYIR